MRLEKFNPSIDKAEFFVSRINPDPDVRRERDLTISFCVWGYLLKASDSVPMVQTEDLFDPLKILLYFVKIL